MDKKKIIFEVDKEFHTKIKVLAARHNVSMTLLIHKALYEYIKKETQYDK